MRSVLLLTSGFVSTNPETLLFSLFDAGNCNLSALIRTFPAPCLPVLPLGRTGELSERLGLPYRRQHASRVVTMGHGSGDPYARMGSSAGRLSSADGRRLRSRSRALSLMAGSACLG